MLSDLRQAYRSLSRSPGFAAAAIISLALGTGATTTIASVYDAAVLRATFPDQDRLLEVEPERHWVQNAAVAERFRAESRVAEQIEAHQLQGFGSVTIGGVLREEQTHGVSVSPGLIPLLGGLPLSGRLFSEADFASGAPKVAILNHGFWQATGGDLGIVGTTMTLDGQAYTVIGVLRPGFRVVATFESILLPLVVDAESANRNLTVVAKLRPGAAPAALGSELSRVIERDPALLAQTAGPRDPANKTRPVRMQPIGDANRQYVVESLLPALGASLFLLLIACANVATLSVARGVARRRELLVRSALGASWAPLARSAAAEAVLVSLGGGGLGLVMAAAAIPWIRELVPAVSMSLYVVSLDPRAVAIGIATALATTTLTALWPVAMIRWRDMASGLRDGTAGSGRGRSGAAAERGLIVAQVAGAFILLTGAGLLIKSFLGTYYYDSGFETAHLAQVQLRHRASPPGSPESRAAIERATLGIESAPAVVAVAAASRGGDTLSFDDGRVVSRNPTVLSAAPILSVTTNYLHTLGVPMVLGRDFGTGDRSAEPTVAIVTEDAARRWWPEANGSVLGKRIKLGNAGSAASWVTVVGVARSFVAAELHYWPVKERAAVLVPLAADAATDAAKLIRFNGDPAPALGAIREITDRANLRADELRTVAASLRETSDLARGTTMMLGAFAIIGVILALIGIVAIVVHAAARRSREFAIRLALGAQRSRVMKAVTGEAALLAGIGVMIGFGLSLALTGILQSTLLGVSPLDPWIFSGAALGFTATVVLACYLPARRTARIDPTEALRPD